MTETIVNTIRSTRHAPPIYQLKRPMQKVYLDDLLSATVTDLLGSVVTTLKDHSQRYTSHLEQQRQLYTTYIKTLTKSQINTKVEQTLTKPCDKLSSCKRPATFTIKTTQVKVDDTLAQEANDIWIKASNSYLTLVDSRVCTQTTVATSRISSLVYHFLRPDISKKDHDTLLDLAWSCLTYLWQQLKLTTWYPPIKLFLYETSESLAKIISSNKKTMDLLVALFEADHESIDYLYCTFNPNLENETTFVQRYQQMTLLVLAVQSSQYSPALEYLIRSFDVDTWTSSDTALDEMERQSFYLASCHFIQQQLYHRQSGNNLATLSTNHMMVLMSSFVRKQLEMKQGDHLYVLHLLLDTLVANTNNVDYTGDNECTPNISFAYVLDAFIETLSQQKPLSIITTQQNWKQQHQPDMKLKWALLNDPGHTLDVLLSIMSQFNTGRNTGALETFGPSGSVSLSRMVFMLLLDRRIGWNFGLLVRSFEQFWKPGDKIIYDDKAVGHQSKKESNHQVSNAQLYITHLFVLTLHLLVYDHTTVKSILDDLSHYCHHLLLDQMDDTWLALFLPMIIQLPWHHLSPLDIEKLDTMLSHCLRLWKHDRLKYTVYSSFVFIILECTIIKDHQRQSTPLEHDHLLSYVEMAFVLLMNADSTWPQPITRLENLEKLWQPIINTPGQLTAIDMENIITTTHIDEPSNWRTTLESLSTVNSSNTNTDQDCLVICIQWIRHLTIVTDNTACIGLISIFGRFMLAHLKNTGNMELRMDWLKVLLNQADEYMTKHDNVSDFMDCVEWFKILLLDMMDQQRNQAMDGSKSIGISRVVETIYDSISISEYDTTLAMFTACIPTPKSTNQHLSTAADTVESINSRILVMEHCLERCLQLRQDQDVWLRVGTLLNDTYFGQDNHHETAVGTVEASISEYIRYSLDLSSFLVLNAYCHAKLHQYYSLADSQYHGKNEIKNNNDHLVAEEIAAILSMVHLDDDKMDIQQTRKIMGIVHLFGKFLSKNKEQRVLDLWLASIVSLARSSTRWSATTGFSTSTHSDNRGWITWKSITTVLECFLASRLALIGIPPYSGLESKDGGKKTKAAHWVTLLERKKKIYPSHKKLFTFAIDSVQDLDHWSLWDLEEYTVRIIKLSLV